MPDIDRYEHGVFCWVDYNAHDLDAASAWYSELFGWKADKQDTQGGPPYVMFTMRDRAVAGMGQMSDDMKGAGIPPMWNSYVNVDDVDAAVKKIGELGGQVMVPAMDVMDAGRMALFIDREGATFAVWQANQHHGAGVVNEPRSFCWNELATKNPGKAAEFYGSLFGWGCKEQPMGETSYTMLEVGDRPNGGMIKMTEEWGDMPPSWMVYFSVENLETFVKSVEGGGGAIVVPPHDSPVGPFSVLRDPQGGYFSAIQLAQQGG